MNGMKEPAVPEVDTHVLTDDELRCVLATCKGRGFHNIRDLAILRVFISSGCRLEELTALKVDDLDLQAGAAHVTGKGRRDRRVGLGVKAVTALGRYLRARERHRRSDLPYLWLGNNGPLSKDGVYGMVKRRGARAGVELHPHSFRHTISHNWLDAAGNEHDLMRLMGWTNPKMVGRYAASTATERALRAHQRWALETISEPICELVTTSGSPL